MATVDQYTLEHGASSPERAGEVSKKPAVRSEAKSSSAALATENARLSQSAPTLPRFPGEDSGRSLGEMARADLDAALQLLADRAQYITGADGAAIALRRGENKDMLCRASVGKNAPELGALLSMEYGLSGESVRTRQPLFCDDAERDQRVNRDVCRELGIASVVVMPILKEELVLGIFELLSGKAKAFNERDLSAVTRLAEMVVTAIKHSGLEPQIIPAEEVASDKAARKEVTIATPAPKASVPPEDPPDAKPNAQENPTQKSEPPAAAKKPLFWSAALQAQSSTRAARSVENAAVPPGLRNLKQCQACGFPISPGRTFCVECEEKQWRGRTPVQAKVAAATEKPQREAVREPQIALVPDSVSSVPPLTAGKLAMAAAASGTNSSVSPARQEESSGGEKPSAVAPVLASSLEAPAGEESTTTEIQPDTSIFLASAMPSESWLSSHKFVVFALLIVAAIIGVVAYFH